MAPRGRFGGLRQCPEVHFATVRLVVAVGCFCRTFKGRFGMLVRGGTADRECVADGGARVIIYIACALHLLDSAQRRNETSQRP